MRRLLRLLRRRAALAAAMAALLAVPAAEAQSRRNDQIDRPAVRDLTLRGVKSVDADELRGSLATRKSSCRSVFIQPICWVSKSPLFYTRHYLDRTELQRDLLRVKVFYYRRGYRETQVDTSVSGAKDDFVSVRFTITEGPPTTVGAVRVVGVDSVLTPRQLRRLVLLRTGAPFDLFALDTTLINLRAALANRGFADARVEQQTAVFDSVRQAAVVFAADPGRRATVAQVVVDGESKLDERTVRNSLTFEEGDVFRPDELTTSQRLLYESGFFKSATVQVQQPQEIRASSRLGGLVPRPDSARAPGSAPGSAPAGVPDSAKTVVVRVAEAPLRSARLSAGFSTADLLQAEGRFTHQNWLGHARRLDVTGTIGNLLAPQLHDKPWLRKSFSVAGSDQAVFLAPTWQASADVQQRWFGDPRNMISGSVFAHRRSAPGVFVDRGYGTSATFTREVADRATASANYRFEITTVEAQDVYYCVNFGICDPAIVDVLRRAQRLSPVTFTAGVTRANDAFAPTRGWQARAELEHASKFTISDFRYNRVYGDAAYYRPMGRRGVLATHLEIGFVRALASTSTALGIPELSGADASGGVVHPRRRFYAGGSQSVRGYAENQLGPRVLTIPASDLRGGDSATKCPVSTPIERCDPNAVGVVDGKQVPLYADADFQPRPIGGNSLVEASVEYRFPIWQEVFGAVFLDGAIVGASSLREVASVAGDRPLDITAALTPGFGVRYRSPVGPIRLDIGINPKLEEALPVVTEEVDDAGRNRLVTLTEVNARGDTVVARRRFNPARGQGLSGLLNRFVIHLSIGEAF